MKEIEKYAKDNPVTFQIFYDGIKWVIGTFISLLAGLIGTFFVYSFPFWVLIILVLGLILTAIIILFIVWKRVKRKLNSSVSNSGLTDEVQIILKRINAIESQIQTVKRKDYILGELINVYPITVLARFDDYNLMRENLIKMNPNSFSGLPILNKPEPNKYRTDCITQNDIKPLLGELEYIKKSLN